MAIARYTLAVDRRFKRDGEATADFIGCVAFGRQAEFPEIFPSGNPYCSNRTYPDRKLHKQRNGNKVYTTDVVVEEQEFAESKSVSDSHVGHASMGAPAQSAPSPSVASADGFMNIPTELMRSCHLAKAGSNMIGGK